MGQNSFLITLALISIFTLAFLNMAIGLGNDVDGVINIGDSSYAGGINTSITTNAEAGFVTSTDSIDSFGNSEIGESRELSVKGDEFKNADQADKQSLFNILRNIQGSIFGEDKGINTIFTSIITLIATIAITLAYKTWIGKNPD